MLSYDRGGPVATTLPYHIAGPQSYNYTRESAHQPAVPVSLSPPSHQHSRSSSSNTFPSTAQILSYQQRTPQNPLRASSAVQSSSASSSQANMSTSINRAPTNSSVASASSLPRRSTSSRSSNSTPTSYVALMRKQKATVWCDRSQSLDARTLAAQRAAKHRAVLEVHGSNASTGARTSTISSGGVVGKIRHGGVPKAPGYVTSGNLSGAGVPVRLSANEMLGDEEEEPASSVNSMVHARTDSGRSSSNSARYRSGYPRPESMSRTGSGNQSPRGDDIGEEEDQISDMQGPKAVQKALTSAKNVDDLRRRGSVDERAMSMGTGVRLFVANPDVD